MQDISADVHTHGVAYDLELADRLREALAGADGVTERAMFGGLAFLVNGNMAVAARGHGGLMVRADPSEDETRLAKPNVEPVRMRGREMKGWLHVEPAGVETDADLARWVEIGVTYARTLPPKH